jgi:hypothetical protein
MSHQHLAFLVGLFEGSWFWFPNWDIFAYSKVIKFFLLCSFKHFSLYVLVCDLFQVNLRIWWGKGWLLFISIWVSTYSGTICWKKIPIDLHWCLCWKLVNISMVFSTLYSVLL